MVRGALDVIFFAPALRSPPWMLRSRASMYDCFKLHGRVTPSTRVMENPLADCISLTTRSEAALLPPRRDEGDDANAYASPSPAPPPYPELPQPSPGPPPSPAPSPPPSILQVAAQFGDTATCPYGYAVSHFCGSNHEQQCPRLGAAGLLNCSVPFIPFIPSTSADLPETRTVVRTDARQTTECPAGFVVTAVCFSGEGYDCGCPSQQEEAEAAAAEAGFGDASEDVYEESKVTSSASLTQQVMLHRRPTRRVDVADALVTAATRGVYASCAQVAAAGHCDKPRARRGCASTCAARSGGASHHHQHGSRVSSLADDGDGVEGVVVQQKNGGPGGRCEGLEGAGRNVITCTRAANVLAAATDLCAATTEDGRDFTSAYAPEGFALTAFCNGGKGKDCTCSGQGGKSIAGKVMRVNPMPPAAPSPPPSPPPAAPPPPPPYKIYNMPSRVIQINFYYENVLLKDGDPIPPPPPQSSSPPIPQGSQHSPPPPRPPPRPDVPPMPPTTSTSPPAPNYAPYTDETCLHLLAKTSHRTFPMSALSERIKLIRGIGLRNLDKETDALNYFPPSFRPDAFPPSVGIQVQRCDISEHARLKGVMEIDSVGGDGCVYAATDLTPPDEYWKDRATFSRVGSVPATEAFQRARCHAACAPFITYVPLPHAPPRRLRQAARPPPHKPSGEVLHPLGVLRGP